MSGHNLVRDLVGMALVCVSNFAHTVGEINTYALLDYMCRLMRGHM